MNNIRWGIIGCGDVTERKSGPGFQNARASALVAVMRRDSAKAADYALRHNVQRWYDDADKLIADPDVDAVYIATPPGTHELYALKVAAAGKPCYVEKPFTRNAPEARRIVDAFSTRRVPLFVAYYRRSLPRFIKARDLVQSGALGTISGLNYRYADPSALQSRTGELPWRLNAEHAGAGLFLDLASHTLDILDFIVGPLAHVSGHAANVARNYAVEDTVSMNFSLATGGVGTALWNFASAGREDLIEISGTLGRVSLSTFGNEPVVLQTATGLQRFDLPNPDPIQQPMIQAIVDELSGLGESPSTGPSALRTQLVMDTALTSYYGSRADNFWTLPFPGSPKK